MKSIKSTFDSNCESCRLFLAMLIFSIRLIMIYIMSVDTPKEVETRGMFSLWPLTIRSELVVPRHFFVVVPVMGKMWNVRYS